MTGTPSPRSCSWSTVPSSRLTENGCRGASIRRAPHGTNWTGGEVRNVAHPPISAVLLAPTARSSRRIVTRMFSMGSCKHQHPKGVGRSPRPKPHNIGSELD